MICGVWSGVMVACGHTFLYLTRVWGRGSSEGLWIKRGQGLELEARVRGQPLIDELFTYGSAGAHR